MFELFNIGFLPVTYLDLLDISIVAILFYWLYAKVKNNITFQVLIGLALILGLSFITEAINLKSINWILEILSDIWLLGFIILFQPELRNLLLMITRSSLFQFFIKSKMSESIDEVVEATIEFSENHIGALIVFPRTQSAKMTIDTGVILNASVSKDLLTSIFIVKSPLHDGAVVIDNHILMAARCILPLANIEKYNGKNLGTRHRAALGLSEQIDAVILIVSEETGWISIAESGVLEMNISKHDLDKILREKVLEEK